MKKLFALIICIVAVTSIYAQDDITIYGEHKNVFEIGGMAIDFNFNNKVDEDEALYASKDSTEMLLAILRTDTGKTSIGIRVRYGKEVKATFYGDCGNAQLKVDETSKDLTYCAVDESGKILFLAIKDKINPKKSIIFVVNPFILKNKD